MGDKRRRILQKSIDRHARSSYNRTTEVNKKLTDNKRDNKDLQLWLKFILSPNEIGNIVVFTF